MRHLALLSLLLCFALPIAYSQSGRVPAGGAGRSNERRPSPTPTPGPIVEVTNAIDSGDVIAVDTSLVTIPVRILDRRNRFIGGLKQENFKVFEDNIEQEIAYFTNEAQPFTVALVLDMSYSTTFKIGEIQSAAIAFIDQLRPEDKIMVISFDEQVHMLCEATNDRGTIYRAIRSTRVSTGTSLYEAVSLTMNDRMRRVDGRKAIVLFTDGVDTTSIRSNNGANIRDAMELDVLIYPIRYDTFADVQSMKNKPQISLPTPGNPIPVQGPGVRTADVKGTTAEEYKEAEDYLNRLADFTGGTVHLASTYGNLNKAFTKIASELREFYSIGYYPKAEGVPGKTRRIKVKTDQTGVAIKARESYVVPKKRKLRTS
jgi:Ca-activated chloride channel family protein